MLTTNDVYKLSSRPSNPENSVLTVYLNVDHSQQVNLNRGFERQLRDMLRSVGEGIQNEQELSAFKTASRRVEDFVARYEVGARGLLAVFDVLDGFFWGEAIDFPVGNQIHWGRDVLAQPLAEALDEYEPVGIVLLDRAKVRLFTMSLGEIKEHAGEQFDSRKVRHIKTVGTDHWGSASQAQRKADEQIDFNLRRVASDVDAVFGRRGVRRMILAGSPEITARLRGFLEARLASSVIGVIDLPAAASAEAVRRAAVPVLEKFERETEEALVNELVTASAKSRVAVVGLSHTLYALNQGRVWRLVYSAGMHAAGFECPRCAALFSVETDACSFCGSAVVPVHDVVERAVDHALRRGARIELVVSDTALSTLSNAGAIGAFLRTRTACGLVS